MILTYKFCLLKFLDSTYSHLLKKTLQYDIGTFYITDNFVVGEINEGVNFDWDNAKVIIEDIYKHFETSDVDLAYISNKVNNYSISPAQFFNFFKNKHKIKSVSLVYYTPSNLAFTLLDNFFEKLKLQKFNSLDAAIKSLLEKEKMAS